MTEKIYPGGGAVECLKQTPLVDLLRGVPKDGRVMYEWNAGAHQNIPYGSMCHDAANEIERIRAERDSLRIQLKQAEERAEYAWKNTNTIEKERQRLETLEKDAERYRWLVDHTYVEDGCLELSVNIYCHASQNRADRDIAVDRAMEESVK